MHTFMLLAGGFALPGICLLVGKMTGGSNTGFAKAALVFLPLWLVGAGINMWVGVAKAGYSVKDELSIFLVLFAVPAAVALTVWWKFKSRSHVAIAIATTTILPLNYPHGKEPA